MRTQRKIRQRRIENACVLMCLMCLKKGVAINFAQEVVQMTINL